MNCNQCYQMACVCVPAPHPIIISRNSGQVMRPDLCDASELLSFPQTPLVAQTPAQSVMQIFANDCGELCSCNVVQEFVVGICGTTLAACTPISDAADTVSGLAMTFNLSRLRFDLPDAKFVRVQVAVPLTATSPTSPPGRDVYRKRECLTQTRANIPSNVMCLRFDSKSYPLARFECKITITYEFC